MPYAYDVERPRVFTDDGLRLFTDLRDQVKLKCKASGCVRFDHLSFTGDSWMALACMDLLIERKEIRRVTEGAGRAGQHEIYEWIGEP